MMRAHVRRMVCALLSVLGARTGQAQGPDRTLVLFDNRDIALLTGATIMSFGVSHWDKRLAVGFTDSAMHARHPGLTSSAKRASIVTETVLMGTGGLTYGIARWRHADEVADVALHSTESVLTTAMFIQVIRGALGRGRPYVVDDSGEVRDTDPYEFNFMRGFTSFNYRSWPSMHAMASFAVASALSNEMRVRNVGGRHVISAALYTASAVPALARMYLDEHWASDIAMGVYLGVFAGQKVVLYSHAHPDNRPDNFFLGRGVRASVNLNGGSPSFSILPF